MSLRGLWALELPSDHGMEWLNMLESMGRFSHHSFGTASAGATTNSSHSDPISADNGSWTLSIIHRLVSYRPMQHIPPTRESHIQEACRLGSLLYMVPVWRLFGVKPIRSATLLENLHSVLQGSDHTWGRLWTLELWVLYMGAMEVLGTDTPLEHWFLDQVASVCLCNGINNWNDGMALVRRILWFACLFEDKNSRLEERMRLRFARGTP